MKHTYYYNGIKLRKSDNDYTHAVVRLYEEADGLTRIHCVACCGNLTLAAKRLQQERNNLQKTIANYENEIKLMREPNYKEWNYNEYGRWCRCRQLGDEQLAEKLKTYVEELNLWRLKYNITCIVELEKD